jgi:hypothetical protein
MAVVNEIGHFLNVNLFLISRLGQAVNDVTYAPATTIF